MRNWAHLLTSQSEWKAVSAALCASRACESLGRYGSQALRSQITYALNWTTINLIFFSLSIVVLRSHVYSRSRWATLDPLHPATRFRWWPENAFRVVESFLLVIPLPAQGGRRKSLYYPARRRGVCLGSRPRQPEAVIWLSAVILQLGGFPIWLASEVGECCNFARLIGYSQPRGGTLLLLSRLIRKFGSKAWGMGMTVASRSDKGGST